ncbi:MAG: GNAT family N-acetyltransferase [Ignavibacteriae bacterium]|nr:GNAT family N-acetyltransferase [Ignavibacteriota bacterium]
MNLKILETNRLLLTGLTPADMKYIFENLPKPEIKKILGHRSEAEYLKEEQKQKNGYSSYNRSFVLFLLTDKESNKIIGRCGLHNWNVEHNRAEIGYVMEDEEFKQKKLMSEAVKSIIHYGFHQLHLNRIEALVGIDNIPSIKILENNNFRNEGVLREHMYVSNKFVDSYVYSLLRNEYESNT